MKKLAVFFVLVVACAGVSWADLIDDRFVQPREQVEVSDQTRLAECQKLGFKTRRNKWLWQRFNCAAFSQQELTANLTREDRLLLCTKLKMYRLTDREENLWYNCSEFSEEELDAAKKELTNKKAQQLRHGPKPIKPKRIDGKGFVAPFNKEKVTQEPKPLPAPDQSEPAPAPKPVQFLIDSTKDNKSL